MGQDTEVTIGEGNNASASDAARELNEVTVPLNSPYNETTTTTISSGKDRNRASFVKRVQSVSADNPPTSNPLGFAAALCGLCTAGFCGILLLGLVNIIPISFIAIGVIYWDKDENCTAADIALLLVIGGVAHLVQGVTGSVLKCLENRSKGSNNPSSGNICVRLFNSFLQLFILGWFIATCYITYSLYSHVDYKFGAAHEDYCNRVLFLFTFWVLTLYFIVLGIVLGSLCCIACCTICFAANWSFITIISSGFILSSSAVDALIVLFLFLLCFKYWYVHFENVNYRF